jgi:hypothetical protein
MFRTVDLGRDVAAPSKAGSALRQSLRGAPFERTSTSGRDLTNCGESVHLQIYSTVDCLITGSVVRFVAGHSQMP